MRLTASAASNPDGTGTNSRCGRQTNSAYAPLIGSAATICPGSIPETPLPSRFTTPTRSQPGVKGSGGLGMNALARHDVGQGDTCGQHSHPHFTVLRFWALFFEHLKCIGPAVVSNDDARVFHGLLPRLPGSSLCGVTARISCRPGQLPPFVRRIYFRCPFSCPSCSHHRYF